MNLDSTILRTINIEKLKKDWKSFSDQINGNFKFNEYVKANVNGPIYKYNISTNFDEFLLTINQTIYINPGANDNATFLEYNLTKDTNQDLFFRIWKKDILDKLFSFQNSKTGLGDIDKKYVIKTNIKRIVELIRNNGQIREMITSKDYLFLIDTKDRNLNIELKRTGIINSTTDFDDDISLLRTLIDNI